MSKKGAKKKKPAAKPAAVQRDTSEIRGFSLLVLSLIILLSMLSFSANGFDTRNWLGLVGYAIGWLFIALFGVSSYILCAFLGWTAWRLLFKKPINNLVLKSFYVALLVISTSMLLTLLEDVSPQATAAINNVVFKTTALQKVRYHLGGAPFYYFYRDLPGFNFFHIFNALGVGIIFSCTWVVSLLFLAKISPRYLAEKLYAGFSHLKDSFRRDLASQPVSAPAPAAKDKDAKPQPAPENDTQSDFLRYVKLRIPNSASGPSSTEQAPTGQNEMLAIQPETNLKARPSLSRKEQTEVPALDLPKLGSKNTAFEDAWKPKKAEIQEIAPPPSPAATPYTKQSAAAPSKEGDGEAAKKRRREAALSAQRVHNGDFSAFKLPALGMLTSAKKLDQSSLKKDLKRKAEVLEETLLSFGIEAKVGQINCGPTITSFEVHPAIGVKVQKIKALENDIALNMEAKSIRIIAPIPGKAAVGIEVPNAQPEEVGFKDMLSAYQQSGRKFHIPILLGKAVNGDYVMSDLAKMPHCIIAGATGSGKSVCINTIVMSIVMNAKPDEIKLIMVDPKKVELTPYTHLPHMLSPVITEPQGACSAMNWLVKEMERRYDLLKQIGVRNIEAFNSRTIDKEFEASLGLEIPEKLPFIVGIIDELADLMMVSSSDIETPIARIAQMARAVGIHLILATQRPSREVITGLIKANFPTRISFKVSSRVNSQIILDDTGAESLLGNGDMLFLPPGASHLVRAQGAFIRDDDINGVVKHICEQAPPNYVIESFDRMGLLDPSAMEEEDPGDALYSQAIDVVLGTGNASTTFLQRKLKIGYARAASLIDMLEKRGIVGPAEGSKPRKILAALPGKGDDEEPLDGEENLD